MEEKKGEQVKEQIGQDKKEDLEFDVDFSKVFSFAKNLNFEKVKNKFDPVVEFIKNHKTLCVLLLVLLLQFLPNLGFLPWGGIWMRMQVKDLATMDNLAVYNLDLQIKNSLAQEIFTIYGNLPDTRKKELIDEQFKIWLKENKENYDKILEQNIKSFKNGLMLEDGARNFPYPIEADPYNYLVYARNYLDHGDLGNSFNRTGTSWDGLSLAPVGKSAAVQANLHPYVLAWFYKVWSFFDPSVHIFYSSSYLPIIFVLMSLVLLFFIVLKVTNDYYSAFFSVGLLSIHSVVLEKTVWGWFDTDVYTLFFPLLISFLLLKIFSSEGNKKYYLSAVLSFVFYIFARAWVGWWFIFDLTIFSLVLTIFYNVFFLKRKKHAKELSFVLIFVVFSFILISSAFLYFGNSDFVFMEGSSNVYTSFFYNSLIRPPFEMWGIKSFVHEDYEGANLWPNVYGTVMELTKYSLSKSVSLIGYEFVFLSFFGILFLFRQGIGANLNSLFALVFFSSWFIFAFYSGLKSMRFFFLLIPVLSVLSGTGVYFLKEKLKNILIKFRLPNYMFLFLIFLLSCLIFFPQISASHRLVFGDSTQVYVLLPYVDDAWWEALNYIKDNSQENAIITTWWDFGHPIKFISERGTTFDGASQNSPLAYWVGRILLTSDEKEAVGILRMLDCGSDSVVELVQNKIKNMAKSVNLLVEISKLEREQARQVLIKKGFDDNTTQNILDLTHCNPPQAFLILSSDVIQKAYAWGHFGGWDFLKADLWFNYGDKTKKEITDYLVKEYYFSGENAGKFYDEFKKAKKEESNAKRELAWISKWPDYVSDPNMHYFVDCTESDKNIVCPNNLVVSQGKPFIQKANSVIPLERLSYIDTKGNFTTKETNEKTNADAALIKSNEKYFSVVSDAPLSSSMFSRLFFLKSHGLKYFKPVKATTQIDGAKVYVWEVDWEGKQNNILKGTFEKEKIEEGDIILVDYLMWTDEGVLDSSIVNWKNKSITKEASFASQETKAVQLAMNKDLPKNIYDALLGLKKGEETVLVLDENNLPVAAGVSYGLEGKKAHLKFKINKIL
ncbi:hypothetical protein HZA97_03475 [Candidatus Woesearchaeota archaeon]|nr:hypothetical protein [Candidatus Woesearchaeota archaeon]